MKLSKGFLIEDVKYDRDVRQEALNFHEQIKKFLIKNKSKLDNLFNKDRKELETTQDEDMGLGIPLLSKTYPDLEVFLMDYVTDTDGNEIPMKGGANFIFRKAGKFKTEYAIVVNCVDFDDTMDDVIDKFSKDYKTTFVHEFVHYKDFKRHKNLKKVVPEKGIDQDDFPNKFAYNFAMSIANDKYYNDNLETNAYYQQVAYQIEDMLKTKSPAEQKEILSSFKLFFKEIVQFLSHIGQEYLSDKNMNKMMKRLYTLWDNLKNQEK